MAAKTDGAGLSRVSSMEQNNHKQGRSGSATPKKPGVVNSVRHNPTKGGGINRATQGRS